MNEQQNGQMQKILSDPKMVAMMLHSVLSGQEDGVVRKALVIEQDTPPIITIPSSMDKLQASKELKRQWDEEETEIDVSRRFDGYKWQDALVAIKVTAEKYFGWINAQQSFMNPPTEIQVVVDYKNGLPIKTTCFHGEFKVHALDAAVCSIGVSGGIVGVSFNIKKKFKKRIEEWYDLVDKHLRNESIYKAKSVAVSSNGGQFGDTTHFEIIETRSNPKIVLNPKEKSVIEQYCSLDMQENGKRTYLFTGAYGNGKTEAAMMLGDEAKRQGMTFFYVKDSSAFIKMLGVAAKYYSPCFIFMEDIDEVGSGEERTHAINALLNSLDGAETKNKSIKVLFTTNHHDAINPALRRPGRLDLIVKFNNPHNETVQQIYRKYFEGTGSELSVEGVEGIDYKLIADATPDCSGAFVSEICKRAVRLAKLNGEITNEIVVAAINTISDHLEMMTDPVKSGDKLTEAVKTLAKFMGKHSDGDASQMDEHVDNIRSTINNAVSTAHQDLKQQIKGGAQDNQKKIAEVKEDTTKIKKVAGIA